MEGWQIRTVVCCFVLLVLSRNVYKCILASLLKDKCTDLLNGVHFKYSAVLETG